MSEWKTYKLGDIYAFSSGLSKSRDCFGRGYDFVTFKDVFDNYFLPDKLSGLVESDDSERNSCSVLKGDVFLTRTSENHSELGLSSVALKDYHNATFNGFTKRLRLKGNVEVHPEFAGFYFRSPKFRANVSQFVTMTTRASLNNEILGNLTIDLPPVTQQITIGKILKCLSDKIELNLQMNQTLEAMAQAIFKEWFVNFNFPGFDGKLVDGLPEGWKIGKLENVIDFSNGYAFKSNELLGAPEGDCYHVFKMGHIRKGGGFNYDGTKSYFKKSEANHLQKFVLRKGDLMMCMTDMKDNVALLGHTALMNTNDRYIVNQRVGLLRSKNPFSIDYPYLYILTNYHDFIKDLRSRANSGVQVNLSTYEIKNTSITIAPKRINQMFDEVAKPIFEKIFFNIEQVQILTDTRDRLLPYLMSGKIEVKADA